MTYLERIRKATKLLKEEGRIDDAEETFNALSELSDVVKVANKKALSAFRLVCDHRFVYNQVAGDGRYCPKCGTQVGSDDD